MPINYSDPVPSLLLATLLFTSAAWDIRFHKIPNWLTFPAAGLALSYHTALNGFSGLLFSSGRDRCRHCHFASLLFLRRNGGRRCQAVRGCRRAAWSQRRLYRFSFYRHGGRYLCIGSPGLSRDSEEDNPQVQNHAEDLFIDYAFYLRPSDRERKKAQVMVRPGHCLGHLSFTWLEGSYFMRRCHIRWGRLNGANEYRTLYISGLPIRQDPYRA